MNRRILLMLIFFSNMVFAQVLKGISLLGPLTTPKLDCLLESTAVKPKIFNLSHPNRLVIDLPNTLLSATVARVRTYGSYTVRVGQFSSTMARIVVESGCRLNYQVQKQDNGHVFVYFMPERNCQSSTLSVHRHQQLVVPPSSSVRVLPRKIVVVIDPGHGGKDPGALGYHHTSEKMVVFSIAKRLRDKINRQPGMMAVLTRNGDYFIDLRRRLDISRRYHPDIFIAIHADAFANTNSHGASVFALSQRGATSEAARWLAEKENYSELGGVNLRGLDDKNGMIRSVLIDLSQTATIQASLKMGKQVLNSLGKITSLHNYQVEQARFVVLKSPDIPSILVETGFISNPREEYKLGDSTYQEQLSQAIFIGIYQYFREYPPRGTKLL